jgi:elongation factor G
MTMQGYPPDRVRNVALVGHGSSGKTTLAEALLRHAGVVARMGRVEDGTTVCDTEPEEIKRGISLSLTVAPIELDGHKINSTSWATCTPLSGWPISPCSS